MLGVRQPRQWKIANYCCYRISQYTTGARREDKLRQGQNLIRDSLRILGFIRIRMSAGSLPKCIGFIVMSAWVIWPVIVKRRPKIPYSTVVIEMEKWSMIRIRDRITTKSWSLLDGQPLPVHVRSTSVIAIVSVVCSHNDRSHHSASLGGVTSVASWSKPRPVPHCRVLPPGDLCDPGAIARMCWKFDDSSRSVVAEVLLTKSYRATNYVTNINDR